jgi:RNA polymerase sigma-70 factor, ECF subfamily
LRYARGTHTRDELELAFRRYYPALREKCRRLLRDPQEADDVAQETFVRFWRADLAGGDVGRVTAWLYRVSTRAAIDRVRASAARSRLAPPSDEFAESPGLGAEARATLDQLARRIPAAELELLLLQHWDGLTQPEIAEVTGLSERTVRRRLHRCMERVVQIRGEE